MHRDDKVDENLKASSLIIMDPGAILRDIDGLLDGGQQILSRVMSLGSSRSVADA